MLIRRVLGIVRGLFPTVSYAVGSVPTYTSGLMGYLLAGKEKVTVVARGVVRGRMCDLPSLSYCNTVVLSS